MLVRQNISFLIAIGLMALPSKAYSDEYPNTIQVYSEKENASAVINCKKDGNETLHCDFTQVRVRKLAKKSELKKKIKKRIPDVLSEFKKNPTSLKKTCSETTAMYNLVSGKTKPNESELKINKQIFSKKFKKMSPTEKKDLLVNFRATKEALCKPSVNTLKQMIVVEHDKLTRTCAVSSQTFKQSFKRDYQTGNWVHTSPPDGICGIVHIGTLEKAKIRGKLNKFGLWNYISTKVVTNKKGENWPTKCSEYDEGEYRYNWRKDDKYLGCDYIKFSAF